jgi:hypothetical protein
MDKKAPMEPPTIAPVFEAGALVGVGVGVGVGDEVDFGKEEDDGVGVVAPGVAEGGPVAKAPTPVAV